MRHINKPSQAQGPYCLIKKIEQYVPNKPEKAWGNHIFVKNLFCFGPIGVQNLFCG